MKANGSRFLISTVVVLAIASAERPRLGATSVFEPHVISAAAGRGSGTSHDGRREMVTQLINQSRAVPRLNVPATTGGAKRCTVSPEGDDGISRAGRPGGDVRHAPDPSHGERSALKDANETLEARATGTATIEGLDFWSPNINIFRDPRWGRGQETYGEDPFLTARLGVAYVIGMQGRIRNTIGHFYSQTLRRPQRPGADASYR